MIHAFAAACVERLWPVYERASAGKPWRRETLRPAIDAVWEWLLGGGDRPRGHAAACQEAIDIFDTLGLSDDADTAGREVTVGVFGLVASVEEKRHDTGAASYNLDFVDAFLDVHLGVEDLDEHRRVADDHELMVLERMRQAADVSFIQAGSSWTHGLPGRGEAVAELRRRSSGVSILGGYWYPMPGTVHDEA